MRHEMYLEEVGQLGVAVGDVRRLGGERLEDIAQAAQRLVDGAGLLGPLSLRLGPCQALTAPCHQRASASCSLAGSSDACLVSIRA